MIFSLENKIAVVTGGASGIGLAITKLFVQQGAKVHVLELSTDVASKQIKDAIQDTQNVSIHACDVSNLAQYKFSIWGFLFKKKSGSIKFLVRIIDDWRVHWNGL